MPKLPAATRDLYYVAVKLFIERNGTFLILKDQFGDWDIPGGRIRVTEFAAPLERVIARKMREELGRGFRYKLGAPIIFMRHQRREKTTVSGTARIFAVGYRAKFISGEIKLSHRHTQYRWASRKTFDASKYFRGGWLKGVKEYQKLRQTGH